MFSRTFACLKLRCAAVERSNNQEDHAWSNSLVSFRTRKGEQGDSQVEKNGDFHSQSPSRSPFRVPVWTGLSASGHLTEGVSAAPAECATQTAHRKDEISVFTSAEHKLYLKTVVVNIFDLQAHKVNGFCFRPLHYGQDWYHFLIRAFLTCWYIVNNSSIRPCFIHKSYSAGGIIKETFRRLWLTLDRGKLFPLNMLWK